MLCECIGSLSMLLKIFISRGKKRGSLGKFECHIYIYILIIPSRSSMFSTNLKIIMKSFIIYYLDSVLRNSCCKALWNFSKVISYDSDILYAC